MGAFKADDERDENTDLLIYQETWNLIHLLPYITLVTLYIIIYLLYHPLPYATLYPILPFTLYHPLPYIILYPAYITFHRHPKHPHSQKTDYNVNSYLHWFPLTLTGGDLAGSDRSWWSWGSQRRVVSSHAGWGGRAGDDTCVWSCTIPRLSHCRSG